MRTHIPGATPIDVRGTYRHPPSGFVFPERLGRFERVAVDQYDDAGNNVGVGYNLSLAESPIAFTIYVRPPGRTEDGATASFEHHFDAELRAIDHYHPDAEQVRRERTWTTQEARSIPGEMAEFIYSDRFAKQDQRVVSQLHLFEFERRIVKYRITFPVSAQAHARAMVLSLLASLTWRSEQGVAGSRERLLRSVLDQPGNVISLALPEPRQRSAPGTHMADKEERR